MKIAIFAFGIVFVLLGCTVHNTTPVTPPATTATSFDSTKATLLKRGVFVGLDGPTSGTASLYQMSGTRYVALNPFESHTGPDLYVYLAKDANASDYIKLGKLQATSGAQVYQVPVSFDPNDYHYVHVWCQMFSVDFARAEIK